MNKRGHSESLVASHPGNTNAVKQGVHSSRLIEARATELEDELCSRYEFSFAERVAAREVARCMAILEAIDRDLDERGVVERGGKPRYLLNLRSRMSRELDSWLSKISRSIERQGAESREVPSTDAYLRELRLIGLGRDPTATAHDQLVALRELLRLEPLSSPPVSAEMTITVITREDGSRTVIAGETPNEVSDDQVSEVLASGL